MSKVYWTKAQQVVLLIKHLAQVKWGQFAILCSCTYKIIENGNKEHSQINVP